MGLKRHECIPTRILKNGNKVLNEVHEDMLIWQNRKIQLGI